MLPSSPRRSQGGDTGQSVGLQPWGQKAVCLVSIQCPGPVEAGAAQTLSATGDPGRGRAASRG